MSFSWHSSRLQKTNHFYNVFGYRALVIETDFDEAYDFSEGLAVGKKGSIFYLIDKTGNKTFFLNAGDSQIEFWSRPKFSDGLIVVYNGISQKCGFMDKIGKFDIEPKFNNAASFSEGLARVSIIENKREKAGFIDRTGEYVIPPKFDIDFDFPRLSTDFSQGLASLIGTPSVRTGESNFIFIDKMGKIVLQPEFIHAEAFHEGLASVLEEKSNKFGYIDKSGELIIPTRFVSVSNFSEGLARVMISD